MEPRVLASLYFKQPMKDYHSKHAALNQGQVLAGRDNGPDKLAEIMKAFV